MTLELTSAEQSVLYSALLTRIRTVEGLIHGWESYPDEHSDYLIKAYTKELETLEELRLKSM
jgi:hypothetical protein